MIKCRFILFHFFVYFQWDNRRVFLGVCDLNCIKQCWPIQYYDVINVFVFFYLIKCRLLLYFSYLLSHRQHHVHNRNSFTQVSIPPVSLHYHLHSMVVVPIHHFIQDIHHQFIMTIRPSIVHTVHWATPPFSNL